jgi:hypothetical protein
MRQEVVSGIRPGFPGLSRSRGQVTHVLLTRSPLIPRPKAGSSSDLHVLSTPPAFVLSQDQTLRKNLRTPRAPPGKTGTGPGTKFKPGRKTPCTPQGRRTRPSINRKNRYQQTWHTIEFSNNRSTRPNRPAHRPAAPHRSNLSTLPDPLPQRKPPNPAAAPPPPARTRPQHAKKRVPEGKKLKDFRRRSPASAAATRKTIHPPPPPRKSAVAAP